MIWRAASGCYWYFHTKMEKRGELMKKFSGVLTVMVLLLGVNAANARDDKAMWSVDDALNTEDAKQKLDKNIRFYFGDQDHPKVVKTYGEFMSNKKTNAFNKTAERACQWNFLSAMMSFQDRAVRMGGNAVINIRSYYKKNTISSQTEFECGSGTFVSGVTFLGDVVQLAE